MLRKIARAAYWGLADSRTFRWVEGLWYRSIHADQGPRRDGVLLIAIPGAGNIGDQAMFEAFLRNTPSRVRAVVRSLDALLVPDDVSHRVELHVLNEIFQGKPQFTPYWIRKFGRLMLASESLAIIGADIADGAYGFRQSWSRIQALHLAVRLGIPARLLGFSWSKQPHPIIADELRRLSGRVELFARDRYSLERLSATSVSAQLVPDTVFALASPTQGTPDPEVKGTTHSPSGSKFVLLNVSGLLRNRHDGLADQYERVVEELARNGYAVILLPHVFRAGDSDVAAAREVLDLCRSKGNDAAVEMIEDPLQPSEIQELARFATMVITGRMHLAILALTVGTPAIVFDTQGKVEGMLAHFDLESFAVDPGPDLAAETISRIRSLQLTHDAVSAQIAARLPEIVERSRVNFIW